MNIIELFENLNIDKSSLLQITSEEIIRIEKQVNVEKKINPDIDVNVANNLIEALRNYPSEFQFIANNRILYNFFSKKSYYRDSFPSQNIEVDNERVKKFLENYLLDDLLLFFDKKSIENKFEEMNDLLVYKECFPEELLYKVSKRAEGKLDFVLSVLNANEQNYFPILFAKQAYFYTFLSHFASTEIDDKVHYLLNEIVDIYNVTKTSEFASSIMISMAKYHSFDEELMDTIASNKSIVQNNIDGREGKSSSGLGFSWRVFGIILFILLKITIFSKGCSSSSSSNYDINNSENMNSIMESIDKKYKNEKSDFFYYLTEFDATNIDSIKNIDNLKTGDKVFKSTYNGEFKNVITDSLTININNKSNFDVVVLISEKLMSTAQFMKPKYSLLLKKNETLEVSKNALFTFYIGNNLASFVTTKTQIIKHDSEHEYRFINLANNSKDILKTEYTFESDVTILDENKIITIDSKGKSSMSFQEHVVEENPYN